MEMFLRACIARAYPRIKFMFRSPSWFLYDALFPLLGVIAFVYVYKALGASRELVGYVILGGTAATFWLNVMRAMSASLHQERQLGTLELYIIAPCGLASALTGMALGWLLLTLVRAAIVFTAGVLFFRVSFRTDQIGLVSLVFLVTLVALYGLGTLFASLFLYWGRPAMHLEMLLRESVQFLAGLYFPVRALGPVLASLAAVIPMTLGLDAIRQLMLPGSYQPLLPAQVELLLLVGLATLFLFLAGRVLRFMEMVARREGRLLLKW